MEEDKVVITKIKKVKHKGGGHGGSSWKVAYADFVTALMAFFLLLWLISMVAPEKQAKVSHYFKHFSLFERGGTSFMGKTSELKVHRGVIEQDPQGRSPKDQDEKEGPGGTGEGGGGDDGEELKERLKEEFEKKLGDVKDQVIVGIVGRTVTIELIDKDGSPMFPMASPKLNPKAREILKVIYDNIARTGERIAIEGHTDAYNYATSNYTNWELSTERASSARKELETLGLSPDRIVRVSGLAATEPLIKENRYDPRNRRIRFLVYMEERTKGPIDLKREFWPKAAPQNAPAPGGQVQKATER